MIDYSIEHVIFANGKYGYWANIKEAFYTGAALIKNPKSKMQ